MQAGAEVLRFCCFAGVCKSDAGGLRPEEPEYCDQRDEESGEEKFLEIHNVMRGFEI